MLAHEVAMRAVRARVRRIFKLRNCALGCSGYTAATGGLRSKGLEAVVLFLAVPDQINGGESRRELRFLSGVDGQGTGTRCAQASKGGILLRAPEEWMEKGANETTPPDVAGAAKTKREQRAASYEKGGFCKNRVELGVRGR